MQRHDSGAVESADVVRPEADVDPTTGIANRDRIEGLAHTDPALGVDSAVERQRHIEGLIRQGCEERELGREVLGHGETTSFDVTVIVSCVTDRHQVVQRRQGDDARDRDHVPAPEPADLSFDAALLVGSLDAGQAEEGLEAVMAAHGDEPLGLDPAAPFHDPHHRRLQVVIANALGHPAEMGERSDVTVEKHLLGLVEVRRGGTPLPLADSRMTNIQASTMEPSSKKRTCPKSTSASSPSGESGEHTRRAVTSNASS